MNMIAVVSLRTGPTTPTPEFMTDAGFNALPDLPPVPPRPFDDSAVTITFLGRLPTTPPVPPPLPPVRPGGGGTGGPGGGPGGGQGGPGFGGGTSGGTGRPGEPLPVPEACKRIWQPPPPRPFTLPSAGEIAVFTNWVNTEMAQFPAALREWYIARYAATGFGVMSGDAETGFANGNDRLLMGRLAAWEASHPRPNVPLQPQDIFCKPPNPPPPGGGGVKPIPTRPPGTNLGPCGTGLGGMIGLGLGLNALGQVFNLQSDIMQLFILGGLRVRTSLTGLGTGGRPDINDPTTWNTLNIGELIRMPGGLEKLVDWLTDNLLKAGIELNCNKYKDEKAKELCEVMKSIIAMKRLAACPPPDTTECEAEKKRLLALISKFKDEEKELRWVIEDFQRKSKGYVSYYCTSGPTYDLSCCQDWTEVNRLVTELLDVTRVGYMLYLSKIERAVASADCSVDPDTVLKYLKALRANWEALLIMYDEFKKSWTTVQEKYTKTKKLCASSSSSASGEGYYCVAPKTGGSQDCRYFSDTPDSSVWYVYGGAFKGTLDAVNSCYAYCSSSSSSSSSSPSSSSSGNPSSSSHGNE